MFHIYWAFIFGRKSWFFVLKISMDHGWPQGLASHFSRTTVFNSFSISNRPSWESAHFFFQVSTYHIHINTIPYCTSTSHVFPHVFWMMKYMLVVFCWEAPFLLLVYSQMFDVWQISKHQKIAPKRPIPPVECCKVMTLILRKALKTGTSPGCGRSTG